MEVPVYLIRTCLVVLMLLTLPIYAVDYPCADNETECGGLASDESVGGSTGGSGSYQPPRTVSCYAMKSRHEACRACVTQYGDDGQPTGKTVCGYVDYAAACSCTISGPACSPNGTCTYFN